MKKLLLIIAALAIIATISAQTSIEKQSKTAENQARNGEVFRAKNTASKTLQNDKVGTCHTHGLCESIQKEADKAREQNRKEKDTKTRGNSTSSGLSTNNASATTNEKT